MHGAFQSSGPNSALCGRSLEGRCMASQIGPNSAHTHEPRKNDSITTSECLEGTPECSRNPTDMLGLCALA